MRTLRVSTETWWNSKYSSKLTKTKKKEDNVRYIQVNVANRLWKLQEETACTQTNTRWQFALDIWLKTPSESELEWNDSKTKKSSTLQTSRSCSSARLADVWGFSFNRLWQRHIASNQAIILYFKSLQKVKQNKKKVHSVHITTFMKALYS